MALAAFSLSSSSRDPWNANHIHTSPHFKIVTIATVAPHVLTTTERRCCSNRRQPPIEPAPATQWTRLELLLQPLELPLVRAASVHRPFELALHLRAITVPRGGSVSRTEAFLLPFSPALPTLFSRQ